MFKQAIKSVCTSTAVVSADPLSPTPPIPSAMRTAENAEEEPDGPEPADEGNIQMEYSSDYNKLGSPRIGAVTKITCKNLGQHSYHLIIQYSHEVGTCPDPIMLH